MCSLQVDKWQTESWVKLEKFSVYLYKSWFKLREDNETVWQNKMSQNQQLKTQQN